MLDYVTLTPHGALRVMRARRHKINTIVIDVDGCLTDGKIYVDATGAKLFKRFGPDDHDAIIAAKATGFDVHIVSADRRGWHVSQMRIYQMGCLLTYAPAVDRIAQIENLDPGRTVYIGDGWHDRHNMRAVAFGIAPHDAYPATRRAADAVTSRNGGDRAVAQAIDFVLRRL